MTDPFDEMDKFFRDIQNIVNSQFSGAKIYRDTNQKVKIEYPGLIVDKDRKKIYFTIDVPHIKSSDDIFIDVTEQLISLKFLLNGIENYQRIELPVKVKPKTTKTTIVRGVLDIEIDTI